jgi:hypothetical protein
VTGAQVVRPAGFVYVDCETTGLDARRHDPYELAWAVDDGPLYSLLLPHRLRYAEPIALEVGGYGRRGIQERLRHERRCPHHQSASVDDFVAAFAGPNGPRTLVAANPAFDAGMLHGKVIGREPTTMRLRRFLRLPAGPAPAAPWHYRLLDIEAYAAGVFGWSHLRGLSKVREHLVGLGYEVPAPDHTAMRDVISLRAIHRACWDHLAATGRSA